jgi:hypothetical protein
MKTGAQLKTKIGLDKNRDEFYFLYDSAGGKQIGSIKEGTLIGTYDRTDEYLLTKYAYVKLATPLAGGYRYAFIRESAVYEYSPKTTTYYVNSKTTKLNVRSSASAASTKNVTGALSRNELIGTSDGTTSNGFLFFDLAKGGTGWVSKNYITTTTPAGVTPTPSTEPDPISDPAKQPTTGKVGTWLENLFGSGAVSTLIWVGVGLVAIAIGISLVRLYGKRRPTKPQKV